MATARKAIKTEAVEADPPRVVLQNLGPLRARRKVLAAAVEAARADLAGAERRRLDFLCINAQPGGPMRARSFSPTDETNVLREDVEAAKADLEAQTDSLALIEQQLAPYETPERAALAARQRVEFAAAQTAGLDAIAEIESLVSGPMIDAIKRYLASRVAMEAALGNGLGMIGDTHGEDGVRKRLSARLAHALRPYVDGRAFDWAIQAGGADIRSWRAQEAAYLANFNIEDLS